MRNLKLLIAIGIIFALSSRAWAAPLISNGLFVYYSFDDVSGSTVYDGSSNGYDGTAYGTITYESGKLGNAANFKFGITTQHGTTTTNDYTLTDNNYIMLPSAALNNEPTSNFTVSAWYYVETDAWTSELFNAEFYLEDSDRKSSVHAEFPANYPTASHRFVLRDDYNKKICDFKDGENKCATNEWHHVAMTYSADTHIAEIFVDGESSASVATPAEVGTADDIGQWIGAYIGVTNDSCRQYYGLIDEFYIYGKTLSDSAIYALAHTSIAGDASLDDTVNLDDLGTLI
ncbi:MAG: LamG domain-containing protein, partial [Pirellulales bacterium]|nr:LamG domain-containing protein [Pirellulales bacterium]